MIAWCGSRSEGLGWLSERCGSIEELESSESLSVEIVDALCRQHPRRFILSVENRLHYPVAEIQQLQRVWPEIPFALAVGSWWDGSRRTGIGATNHMTMPWYRWWDAWRGWLKESQAELLGPWPKVVSSRAQKVAPSTASGIILCNCRQTAAGWLVGLQCDPGRTQLLTLGEFKALNQPDQIASAGLPDWLLWDDSCLDTFAGADSLFAGADSLNDVCDLFRQIRTQYSGVRIIAATCMPRWSDWKDWMAAGASELIAKPGQGISLNEILTSVVES